MTSDEVYEMQTRHEQKCDERQVVIHAKIDRNTAELHALKARMQLIGGALIVLSPVIAAVVTWALG